MPILPANLILNLANGDKRLMTYESLSDGGFATGTMMGSGGFIAFDEDQCMVRNTWNFSRFYHHESCGQCSPCREGTGWMEKVLHRLEYGHRQHRAEAFTAEVQLYRAAQREYTHNNKRRNKAPA